MIVAWDTDVSKVLELRTSSAGPPLTPDYLAFSNAPEILAISGTLFTAAMMIVLLRCYVRIGMLRVFGLDDYVVVVSMILATATFSCFVTETHYGLGGHLILILTDPNKSRGFEKTVYFHSLIIMIGVSTVKISIAFALIRLSSKKSQARFLQAVIACIVVVTLGCAGTLILQCIPVEAAWDIHLRPPPLGTGHARCWSNATFRNIGLMNSVFNIVTDALFAILPMPLIWKLQISRRTKISLAVILSFGWVAVAAAIVKGVSQYTVLDQPDWSVHDAFHVWNYIELTVGIIAASLPSLKPLFSRALQNMSALSSGGRSKNASRPSASSGSQNAGRENDKDVALERNRSEKGGMSRPQDRHSFQISGASEIESEEAWGGEGRIRDVEMGPRDIVMTRDVDVR